MSHIGEKGPIQIVVSIGGYLSASPVNSSIIGTLNWLGKHEIKNALYKKKHLSSGVGFYRN